MPAAAQTTSAIELALEGGRSIRDYLGILQRRLKLMTWMRSSARLVTVERTNSCGISCSLIRIVAVERYTAGKVKATRAPISDKPTNTSRISFRRRCRMPR